MATRIIASGDAHPIPPQGGTTIDRSGIVPPGHVAQNSRVMLGIAFEIEVLARKLIDVETANCEAAPMHRAILVRLIDLSALIASMAEGEQDTAPVLERLRGLAQ